MITCLRCVYSLSRCPQAAKKLTQIEAELQLHHESGVDYSHLTLRNEATKRISHNVDHFVYVDPPVVLI